MALTASKMIGLGTLAPDFLLLDTMNNSNRSYEDVKGLQATVLLFICNHCPYVIHIMPELQRLIPEYSSQGCAFVAISSNDVQAYPQDGPDLMPSFLKKWALDIPYFYDENQSVARAYDAACTPDFYVFDAENYLVYRGRLDDSRPRDLNPKPLTGLDLRSALDSLLAKKTVSLEQYPSMGCNIKWKNN
jgi:peroxiredoxin